jgi:carboxymethylenebutenolidase
LFLSLPVYENRLRRNSFFSCWDGTHRDGADAENDRDPFWRQYKSVGGKFVRCDSHAVISGERLSKALFPFGGQKIARAVANDRGIQDSPTGITNSCRAGIRFLARDATHRFSKPHQPHFRTGQPVGHDIKLTASDHFQLGGYRADPAGTPKAAVVVIQEIFGVNHHIRSVCDRLAHDGYVAVAPSIFDRIEPNFQSGYSPDEVAVARKFVANPDWAAMLRDTQAAIDAVKDVGPVGIIGFCLGGSVAYTAATKLSGLKAAIGYYGGAIVRSADDKPKVPTQLHFGEKDSGIPLTDVEAIRAKRPDVEIHIYPDAQHGFNCDERPSYDKASADIAWPRSLDFFGKYLKA